MSVIAVRCFTEGGYEISADSIVVRGNSQRKGRHNYFGKLKKIKDIIIAGTGYAQDLFFLFNYLLDHRPGDYNEQSICAFMCEFAEWSSRQANNVFSFESTFYIGTNEKIFRVEDLFVEEILTYDAIGAGCDFAMASLYHGHSTAEAVKCAIELCVFCEGPSTTYLSGDIQ